MLGGSCVCLSYGGVLGIGITALGGSWVDITVCWEGPG